MIGAPGGSTFKLFEDTAQKSHELLMRMPSSHLAAPYWTLHESAFHKDNRDSYTSPSVVPEPGVFQHGRSDNYPFGLFGKEVVPAVVEVEVAVPRLRPASW
jgi:hypothetical protein